MSLPSPPRCTLPHSPVAVFGVGGTRNIALQYFLERQEEQEEALSGLDRSAAVKLVTPAPREVDSGIAALGLPLAVAAGAPHTPPSTPFSTASAPATAVGTNAVGAVAVSLPGISPPLAVHLPASLDVDLKELEDDFAMAQMAHPGKAAVFVGNLPAVLRDDQLAYIVRAIFSRFGPMHIFVRRTYTPTAVKPWALLQYHNRADAVKAVDNGDDYLVLNRVMRVEFSRARRYFAVLPSDGRVIKDPEELKTFYSQFGEVERVSCDGSLFGWRVTFVCYGAFVLASEATESGNTPYFRTF